MSTRIAPSAALEAAIEELLAEGLGDGERLAEIGRLGAQLVLQRAVEEEVTTFEGEDDSWSMEWEAAVGDFETGSVTSATAADALATIEWIYRLYRASAEGRLVTSDDSPWEDCK